MSARQSVSELLVTELGLRAASCLIHEELAVGLGAACLARLLTVRIEER